MSLEVYVFTDAVLAGADAWLAKGRPLRGYAERHGLSLDSLYSARYQRRRGPQDGSLIRRLLEWQSQEGNVLRMIRQGATVADLAEAYGIKKPAMKQRLRTMGLTADIRREMALGKWDEGVGED